MIIFELVKPHVGYFALLKLIFQFIWNQVLMGISGFFRCYTEKLCPPWTSGSSLDLGWNYGHQLEKCIHRRRPKFHRGAIFGRYPQVSITCDLLVHENTLPTNQLSLTSSNEMLQKCLSKLLCKKFWGVFVDLECILLLHIWHFSGTLVICLNMFVAAVYRTIPSNEEIYLRIHYWGEPFGPAHGWNILHSRLDLYQQTRFSTSNMLFI